MANLALLLCGDVVKAPSTPDPVCVLGLLPCEKQRVCSQSIWERINVTPTHAAHTLLEPTSEAVSRVGMKMSWSQPCGVATSSDNDCQGLKKQPISAHS